MRHKPITSPSPGICFRLFTCVIFLSSCFRYQIDRDMVAKFETMQSFRGERDKYCNELSVQFIAGARGKPIPSMYTEYGKCLESGYIEERKYSNRKKTIAPDLERAKELYKAAAQCNNEEAIKILTSRGVAVPPFSGREEGSFFFPQLTRDQECGVHSQTTGWGYLLSAPIVIPVGAVVVVGALLTPVVCAVTSPFHGKRCM